VTGVQTCALPISCAPRAHRSHPSGGGVVVERGPEAGGRAGFGLRRVGAGDEQTPAGAARCRRRVRRPGGAGRARARVPSATRVGRGGPGVARSTASTLGPPARGLQETRRGEEVTDAITVSSEVEVAV